MAWQLSEDMEAFVTAAGPWLRRDPVANTAILTAVDEYRAGQRWAPAAPLFGWCGRQVRAALCRFPPYELALTAMSAVDAAVLADALAGRDVPAVRGPLAAVHAFADQWQHHSGTAPVPGRTQRLYALTRLSDLARPSAGAARPAATADVSVVTDWLHEFSTEAGSVAVDRTAWVRTSVAAGLVWLGHDEGEPVAVACRHTSVAAVSRLGPVYTPPRHRQRGYGTAVTAAITADALAHDTDQVVLFADQANPTASGV